MTESTASAAVEHPAPQRGHVSLPALWFGLIGGPLGWSIQTLVNLPVASHGCFPRYDPLSSPTTPVRGFTFGVSVVALVVCIAAATVAVRSWSRTRGEQHGAAGRGSEHGPRTSLVETGEGRTRFMALCGVLVSLTFLVASLVHTAAIFLIAPCAF